MVRWTCLVTLSVRRFEAMSLPAAPRGRCLVRFIHMGPMWCHVTSCHIHVLGSMISIHAQIPHRGGQERICNVRCILCFTSVRSQFYCNPKRSNSHWICGGTNHATCQVNFCPISDSLWPKQKHLTVGGVSCVSVPVSQFFRLDPREKPGTTTTPWIPMTPGPSAATTTASLTSLGRRKWPQAVQLLQGLRPEALDAWIFTPWESLPPGKGIWSPHKLKIMDLA